MKNAAVIDKLDNEILRYIEAVKTDGLKGVFDKLGYYFAIRGELKTIGLTKPCEVALLNNPDLLLSANKTRLRYDSIPSNEFTEVAFRFISDVYHDERKNLLAAKIQVEMTAYQNELKGLTSEQVTELSEKTSIYNDFANFLNHPPLDTRGIDTLMTYPNILNALYDMWVSNGYSRINEQKKCIEKCVESQEVYLQENPNAENVDKGEKAIWDAMYDGEDFRVPDDEVEDNEATEGIEP